SLVELHFAASGGADLAVVEGSLRHPNPVAWGACELVGKQVRILHAETAQDDFALVRLAIAIGIAEQDDVRPVLDIDAVFVRENAERNGETVGEEARLMRTGPVQFSEEEDFALGFARVKPLG